MTRLTDWVLTHGRIVVLAWVVLTIAGAVAASQISDALSQSFSAPGREGFDANREIAERFGAGGATSPIVLVARDGGGAQRAFGRIAQEIPGARLLSAQTTGDEEAFRARAGRTQFALVAVP